MNGKRFVLTLMAGFLCAGHLFADEKVSSTHMSVTEYETIKAPKEPAKVTWGVRGAFTLNNLGKAYDVDDGYNKEVTLPGISAGISLTVTSQRLVRFQTGLYYDLKGDRLKYERSIEDRTSTSNSKQRSKIMLGYVKLPLLVSFQLFKRENSHIELSAGPYIAFALHGKVIDRSETNIIYTGLASSTEEVGKYDLFGRGKFSEERTQNGIVTKSEEGNADDIFYDGFDPWLQRIDLGFTLKAAYVWNQFYAGVYADLGIFDIHKNYRYDEAAAWGYDWINDYGTNPSEMREAARNHTLGFMIGYNF